MQDAREQALRSAYQAAAVDHASAMTAFENARMAGTQSEYLAAFRAKAIAYLHLQAAKDALEAYCASKKG